MENQTVSKNQPGRGGKRPGAGRPKGSLSKMTREIANRAAESGVTPLEYMLDIMRSPPIKTKDVKAKVAFEQLRFEAAKAAAPYIHPRLQAIEHSGPDGKPLQAPQPVFNVTVKG